MYLTFPEQDSDFLEHTKGHGTELFVISGAEAIYLEGVGVRPSSQVSGLLVLACMIHGIDIPSVKSAIYNPLGEV